MNLNNMLDQQIRTIIKHNFQMLDKNKNGYIEKEELHHLADMILQSDELHQHNKKFDPKSAKDQAEKVIASIDSNQDKQISEEEFQKAMHPLLMQIFMQARAPQN